MGAATSFVSRLGEQGAAVASDQRQDELGEQGAAVTSDQRQVELSAALDDLFVGRALGEGSYGKVYACRPRTLGNAGDANYAVKVVPLFGKRSRSGDITVTAREKQLNLELSLEVQVLQMLAPHTAFIPALLASKECLLRGAGELRLLFQREYCTLRDLMCNKLVDESVARFYIANVAEGLAVAHHYGIVHRDVKPDNVLVGEDGYAKLGDWGCSRILDHCCMLSLEPSDISAPGYRAPEVWKKLLAAEQCCPQSRVVMPYSRSIDLWSLGAVCFELVTGRDLLLDRPQCELDAAPETGIESTHSSEYQHCVEGITAYVQSGGLVMHTASCSDRVWAQRLMSDSVSPAARSILSALLTVEPTIRLGMSTDSVAAGFDELRAHEWFSGFDWEAMQTRRMAAPQLFSINHDNDWAGTEPDTDRSCHLYASAGVASGASAVIDTSTMTFSEAKASKRRQYNRCTPADLGVRQLPKRSRRQHSTADTVDTTPHARYTPAAV